MSKTVYNRQQRLLGCLVVVACIWLLFIVTMQHPLAPGKHKLLVVSVGGVGTTYLMTAIAKPLSKWYVINDWRDFDGFKHGCSSPTLWRRIIHGVCGERASKLCNSRGFGPPTHVLYVLGDPEVAVLSHLRRGSAAAVYATMHGIPRINVSIIAPWALSSNLNDALTAYMAATAALGDDAFGFRVHLESWKNCIGCPSGMQIMFTSLARAAETPAELERFLGVPSGTLRLQYLPKGRSQPTNATLLGAAKDIMQNLTAWMKAADGTTLKT